ncbi:inositol polyphosphate 5-phosphatase [Tulasnella sp. 332]|nr:inositol polyphosphate 5-phosphatase [Tulasnella sp. 332]
MISLLYALSYIAGLAAFVFVTLSLASGLLWLAEVIEENSKIAKTIGIRLIYSIIILHLVLLVTDALPLKLIAFSIVCHLIYLQNFSSSWPLISLTSWSFLASCVLVVADHFLWFFHFANQYTRQAQESRRQGGTNRPPWQRNADLQQRQPSFAEIASFFASCIWLVPLFLFLSLSANDNALPTNQGDSSVPSTPKTSGLDFGQKLGNQQPVILPRQSLFKTLFDPIFELLSMLRLRRRRRVDEGLIAPRTPITRSPILSPTPMTPGGIGLGFHLGGEGNIVNNDGRQGAVPKMRQPPPRRVTSDGTALSQRPEDELRGLPARALVFRAGKGSQAIVEFLRKCDVDTDGLIRLTPRPVEGCLGLINVENDVFLAVVTSTTALGNLRPSAAATETVHRIHEVAFFCVNTHRYDSPYDDIPTTPFDATEHLMTREQQQYAPTSQSAVLEHPCAPLNKIFASGTFYYSPYPYWDLSTRLSERLKRQKTESSGHDLSVFDPRFIWNEFIVKSLLEFRGRLEEHERKDLDHCQFIILAIQGYVGIYTIPLPAPPSNGGPMIGTLGLISRLGWKRAGTRFNTRGVDDEGNVANFVEVPHQDILLAFCESDPPQRKSETIFSTNSASFSYVQVRGSVPLFWEQQGIQTFGHKIQITRPQLASQPAFERHFAQLLQEYSAVHAVNLLGQKEGEALLAQTYSQHLKATEIGSGHTVDVEITNFDFHNVVRLQGHDSLINTIPRLPGINAAMEKFGFTSATYDSNEPMTSQHGIFRTNCLDCLDRTNFVEDILSKKTLEQFLFNMPGGWSTSITLWGSHRELWAENGDALSKIYAGTGALNTSFTRSGKRTLAGVLSDATKSISRAYINNFQDSAKQSAIDLLLGNFSNQTQVLIYDPVHNSVRAALVERISEYSTRQTATIFIGTYNLNGKPPSESLLPWLFPSTIDAEPDIIVLGFQEIVPLNAQQIIQTDPAKKLEWERHIMYTLENRDNPQANYLILRSEQLVGTALLVIVKSELTKVIRNVEASSRKTGLKGMSGNKGAVAIRLDYHDTSFCFLTAHLAAGHSNVTERNNDYNTIDYGLRFSKGRNIKAHDTVFWAADTNYRIDMENEEVRQLASEDNLQALLQEDQLLGAMHTNAAFSSYKEAQITFRPTYRYDLNSDNYDTSEKQRIPAWTVYAVFDAEVLSIDVAKRDTLQKSMLQNATSTDTGIKLDDMLVESTFGQDEEVEFPPPSSADTRWWDTLDPQSQGLLVPDASTYSRYSSNPFDSPDSPSTSSSDEELYRLARPATDPGKKIPVPPR